MPLTLVTGRANSGKTGVMHDAVRAAVAQGRIALLVVPGTSDARAARDEFARNAPILGVGVATFDELAADLWYRHGDGRTIVSKSQRLALLRRAIATSDLAATAASAARPGFLALCARLAELPAAHPRQKALASRNAVGDILRIMQGYRQLLEAEGLVEAADALGSLADVVDAGWFEGPLVFNRFADLTVAQEGLVAAAADAGAEVFLSLPWEQSFPATRALDTLVRRLRERGAALSPVDTSRFTTSDEIAYVESHLFREPAKALGGPVLGDVRLSEAFGEEAEADRIASEVIEAVAEGVEHQRIGVVFREPGRHLRSIMRALDDAGIPASYDVLVPPDTTGWGRALLHLLRYALDGRRTDLLAYLRTAYSGMSRSVGERLEQRWRSARVIEVAALEADLCRDAREAHRLVHTAKLLVQARLDPTASQGWKELADHLLRNAYGGDAPCLDQRARSDASAHRAFCTIVDELGRLSPVDRGAASARELVEGFTSDRIPLDPERLEDAVQVLSAHRVRSRRFDVLIVGGLVDGDFPQRLSEDALSPPSVATQLEAHGLALQRTDEQDLERLLFYLVVTRATRRLVLSRQVADSDGQPLRPSWLLEEFLDLYRAPGGLDFASGTVPPVRRLGFDDCGLSPEAPPTLRRALRSAARAGAEVRSTEATARRLAEARRRAGGRTPGLMSAESLEFLARERPYSATEIEDYLNCPYAWFHGRVVRAAGIDERLDALAQGAIMHEALRRIYERLPERTGRRRVTQETASLACDLAAEVIDEVIASHEAPATFGEEAAFVSVKRHVVGFVRADADFLPEFEPTALELEFGKGVPVSFGDFGLVGRIDRVDENATGELVLTDYKRRPTLEASFSQAKAVACGKIQLLLYARVAEKLLGRPVVGGFFRGVSARNVSCKNSRGFFDGDSITGPGLVSTDRVSAEQIQERLGEAEALAAEAVAHMRSGDIDPKPRAKESCRHCRARPICPGVTS